MKSIFDWFVFGAVIGLVEFIIGGLLVILFGALIASLGIGLTSSVMTNLGLALVSLGVCVFGFMIIVSGIYWILLGKLLYPIIKRIIKNEFWSIYTTYLLPTLVVFVISIITEASNILGLVIGAIFSFAILKISIWIITKLNMSKKINLSMR